MDIKRILIALTLVITTQVGAFATQLPKSVHDFILNEQPKAFIRFDGLVTLPDDTVYIPVIPSYLNKVEKVALTYSYPDKTSFKDKPEVIILNNNYAFLRILKNRNGILTVCQNPNVPILVKTGAIPQDLVVPRGLVFPDTLKGILGDVQLPLLSSTNMVPAEPKSNGTPMIVQSTKIPGGSFVNPKVQLSQKLKNKTYYVANNNSSLLKVFSSESPEPIYSLKFSGVPKAIEAADGGKYLLVISNYYKQLEVIDVQNEYIAKQVDLSVYPSELLVSDKNKKAYISSVSDKSIFIMDLKDMKVKEKINIIGSPAYIAISDDGSQLAYLDKDSSNIYILKLDGTYENKLIANRPNASKLLIVGNKLYSTVRTEGKVFISEYDLDRDFFQEEKDKKEKEIMAKEAEHVTLSDVIEGISSGIEPTLKMKSKLIEGPKYYTTTEKSLDVGMKPTDMLLYNDKIYILSSGSNTISVLDIKSASVLKTIVLPTGGFPRKIARVNDSSTAIVTNVAEKRYAVLDLDKDQVVQTVNINTLVNEISVVDKK